MPSVQAAAGLTTLLSDVVYVGCKLTKAMLPLRTGASALQDVEIIVQPVPRIVSTWLIGIGKIISTLIRLKVRCCGLP